MQKQKNYDDTRFSADVLVLAERRLREVASNVGAELTFYDLTVEHDDSTWKHDSIEEFLADYRKYGGGGRLDLRGGEFGLFLYFQRRSILVSVQADSRPNIESVFAVFESARAASALPKQEFQKAIQNPIVFIGHGHSSQWRDLKDHLHEKHGYCVEAYETGARAGHTIRDILEDMVGKSSFAVLVMTGEDEQVNGALRARQNVVHEAGLFQGRLGFPRAILLLEESVEEFSNVQGVQYIRFSKDNIKETFGEVLATLRREFNSDG